MSGNRNTIPALIATIATTVLSYTALSTAFDNVAVPPSDSGSRATYTQADVKLGQAFTSGMKTGSAGLLSVLSGAFAGAAVLRMGQEAPAKPKKRNFRPLPKVAVHPNRRV